MARRKYVYGTSLFYRGYAINPDYTYDQVQLDHIINALEFYNELSRVDSSSNYAVFEATINIHEILRKEIELNSSNPDEILTNFFVNHLKRVLDSKKYFYRWTKEFKDTKNGSGQHFHLMIVSNHMTIDNLYEIQKDLLKLSGIENSYMASRLLKDNDPRKDNNEIIHFHNLRDIDTVDGLNDAILRYCYNSKVEQKIAHDKRSFGGCHKPKPLSVISTKVASEFKNKALKKRAYDLEAELNAFDFNEVA